MAAEKVVRLGLVRDYTKHLYYLTADGSVARKEKHGEVKTEEILHHKAVTRDNNFLYYIDKDGDISRSPRSVRTKKETAQAAS